MTFNSVIKFLVYLRINMDGKKKAVHKYSDLLYIYTTHFLDNFIHKIVCLFTVMPIKLFELTD